MSTRGVPGRRADAERNRLIALEAAQELLADRESVVTVGAVAKRAGLGAGTVVRAFGGKDALFDAAIAELLEPVVRRARDLHASEPPERALRIFLGELIAFQAAHYHLTRQMEAMEMPATAELRAELVASVRAMLEDAAERGSIRADLGLDVATALVGQTAYAVARAGGDLPELAEAYLTVLMDGLRPQR